MDGAVALCCQGRCRDRRFVRLVRKGAQYRRAADAGRAREPEFGAFANLDFLPSASAVLTNLVPDRDGVVELRHRMQKRVLFPLAARAQFRRTLWADAATGPRR